MARGREKKQLEERGSNSKRRSESETREARSDVGSSDTGRGSDEDEEKGSLEENERYDESRSQKCEEEFPRKLELK